MAKTSDNSLVEFSLRATQRSNNIARAAVTLGRNIETDPRREQRLKAGLCRTCFYRETMAGAAVTHSTCEGCGTGIVNGSTAVAALCRTCADEHGLCVRCGAERDGSRET